jgi:hypothetical protein
MADSVRRSALMKLSLLHASTIVVCLAHFAPLSTTLLFLRDVSCAQGLGLAIPRCSLLLKPGFSKTALHCHFFLGWNEQIPPIIRHELREMIVAPPRALFLVFKRLSSLWPLNVAPIRCCSERSSHPIRAYWQPLKKKMVGVPTF